MSLFPAPLSSLQGEQLLGLRPSSPENRRLRQIRLHLLPDQKNLLPLLSDHCPQWWWRTGDTDWWEPQQLGSPRSPDHLTYSEPQLPNQCHFKGLWHSSQVPWSSTCHRRGGWPAGLGPLKGYGAILPDGGLAHLLHDVKELFAPPIVLSPVSALYVPFPVTPQAAWESGGLRVWWKKNK